MSKPDFTAVPPLTQREKDNAFAYWGRKCMVTGCSETENLDVDHVIPRALGGTNVMANTRPRCRKCHNLKTWKSDLPCIAKAKSLEKKHYGEPAKKKPIPNRGFDPGRTRGFSGMVKPKKPRRSFK